MFKNLRIKHRLVLAFAALLVLATGILTPVMLASLSDATDRAQQRELSNHLKALEATVNLRSETGGVMAGFVAAMPDAQRAFAVRDRDALAAMLLPAFSAVSQTVEQFQFHLPPATSFLRLHMPKKFGDDLSSFRHTVVQANETAKPITGLERGVAGLGIRAVQPVALDGRHLGTVEFGMDFGDDLVQQFKAMFGIDLAIHIAQEGGAFKTIATTMASGMATAEQKTAALAGDTVMSHGFMGEVPVTSLVATMPDYSGKPAAVVELVMDSSEFVAEYAAARRNALAVGGAILIVGLATAWLLARGISAPMVKMTKVMNGLAEGRLDLDVPALERGDEVGRMAQAVEVFKRQAVENRRLVADQEEVRRRAEADRKATIGHIAEDIEEHVGEVVDTIASASTQMVSTAEGLSHVVEQAHHRAEVVAQAAEEASSNVQTVAAAAEELSSAIAEITRQMSQSTKIAGNAVDEARRAEERMGGLAEAVRKIGEVVHFINDIAGQTNLLALNATIEAARAGDAGKGFAVVAGEVKNLALQTSRATDEIAGLIAAVQNATKDAVGSIEEMNKVIGTISEITTAIASAVEEQGAATQEIARNVNEAATGTRLVSDNIHGVEDAVVETERAADSVLEAGQKLSQQAEVLKTEVDHSLQEMRAA